MPVEADGRASTRARPSLTAKLSGRTALDGARLTVAESYVVRAELLLPERPAAKNRHHIPPPPPGTRERLVWYTNRVDFYRRLIEARRRSPIKRRDMHKLKLTDEAAEHELVRAIVEKVRLESKLEEVT